MHQNLSEEPGCLELVLLASRNVAHYKAKTHQWFGQSQRRCLASDEPVCIPLIVSADGGRALSEHHSPDHSEIFFRTRNATQKCLFLSFSYGGRERWLQKTPTEHVWGNEATPQILAVLLWSQIEPLKNKHFSPYLCHLSTCFPADVPTSWPTNWWPLEKNYGSSSPAPYLQALCPQGTKRKGWHNSDPQLGFPKETLNTWLLSFL